MIGVDEVKRVLEKDIKPLASACIRDGARPMEKWRILKDTVDVRGVEKTREKWDMLYSERPKFERVQEGKKSKALPHIMMYHYEDFFTAPMSYVTMLTLCFDEDFERWVPDQVKMNGKSDWKMWDMVSELSKEWNEEERLRKAPALKG